ncbi:MAG TPA: right-handed parallel beta-helix repeat-containing protein [Actinomycetota bacterium]|nr:right-handed parallel beta-helix repeat-containing protein [Actinomycetota bacterium]
MRALLAAAVVAGLVVPGASAASASGANIRCVDDVGSYAGRCTTGHDSIQAAVNAAEPGDLVLIGPGTYSEEVVVGAGKDGITIRGTDRNDVHLEGDSQTDRYGFLITARGVEVANMTASGFTHTAFFWTGTAGYHGRYLTAYNNGIYGVYALGSSGPGLFEKSYASGNPDAGFYIGECNPCDATIRDVDSVNNGLGYSGTNASGNLVIEDSRWIANGAGILPNTLDSEKLPPQCCIVIRNNLIQGSGSNPDVPLRGINAAAFGMGIGLAGSMYTLVHGNQVFDSNRYGIVVFPFPHETPNVYRAAGNRVERNTVADSGFYDLSLAAGSGDWNCFGGNTFATSDPPRIETLYGCEIQGGSLRNLPVSGGPVSTVELVTGLVRYSGNDNWRDQPVPDEQETMPDPLAGF